MDTKTMHICIHLSCRKIMSIKNYVHKPFNKKKSMASDYDITNEHLASSKVPIPPNPVISYYLADSYVQFQRVLLST